MADRILIIDDEWAIAQALCARLAAHGFQPKSEPDGPRGIAAARALRPDAILLDVRMPGMSGFEVLSQLQSDPALAGIPVIFVTANVQDTARAEAKACGAAGFFCKPYDPVELVAALRTAIQASRKGSGAAA